MRLRWAADPGAEGQTHTHHAPNQRWIDHLGLEDNLHSSRFLVKVHTNFTFSLEFLNTGFSCDMAAGHVSAVSPSFTMSAFNWLLCVVHERCKDK